MPFCVMVLTNALLHEQQPIDLAVAVEIEHDLDGPIRSLMCGRSPRCVTVAASSMPARRRKNCTRLDADRADIHLGVARSALRLMAPSAALNTFMLSAPHRPRSVLITMMPTACTGRSSMNGCL